MFSSFSLLYSKFLPAKFGLFVFGANFAASHWQCIAYLSALFVANVSKFSRACGSDAKTGDSYSRARRIEPATSEVLFFKAYFYLFFLFLFI